MYTSRFGGSVLGLWRVKDAGDVETFVLRMMLVGLVKYLWGSATMMAQLMMRSGEDWSPLVAQGLSFCILDRPNNCCRLWRRAHRFCVLF